MTSSSNTSPAKPRVVIVGAGFGGLYAAQNLAHAPVQVTIIDKNNYHLFQPMLYQVATGELSADQIAAPVRAVLRNQKNAEVLLGEVTGVDAEKHLVRLGDRAVPYDYLILATGSHYNYFGHDEWQQYSPSLKSVSDAIHIRGKLLEAFEAAERLAAQGGADEAKIRDLLTFVLVGAGPTGVELSGSISEMTGALLPSYHHLRRDQVRVILVDALPRILNAFPEDLAEQTLQKLKSMGVEMQLGKKVQQVDAEGVTVQGKDGPEERIASRVVLWTAGTIGSSAGQWLNAPVDKDNRIKVNPDFSVPGHDNVFAIGDTALLMNKPRDFFGKVETQERPLPGVAQPAMQGGQYVAKLIRRRVRGLPPAAAVPILRQGRLGPGRQGLRRGRFEGFEIHRPAGLAAVARHPHLLSDRLRQPPADPGPVGRDHPDHPARRPRLHRRQRPARPRSRRRRLPRRQVTPERGTMPQEATARRWRSFCGVHFSVNDCVQPAASTPALAGR